VIHFAATVLEQPLDPWQQWLVIHLGEMLDDGRPRFRQVLVLVARQNGKTHLCKVLALFWMFVERWPLVFGTSTDLEQAKEAWEFALELAEGVPALAAKMHRRHKRVGNGQQVFWTVDRSRYRISAANRKGGRGKSIDRAIGDELREQHTWDAYNAAYNAMNLRARAQVVYITNMGDDRSVVLNSLRKASSGRSRSSSGRRRPARTRPTRPRTPRPTRSTAGGWTRTSSRPRPAGSPSRAPTRPSWPAS
jgi:phage terminase large subunit-like protein